MKGFAIGSDYHATFVVAALDLGVFPLVFSNNPFDKFGYYKLIGDVAELADACNHTLERYFPQYRVSRDGDLLIWRPDPEFNFYGYRARRYIKFLPIGVVKTEDDGKTVYSKPLVIMEWESGHETRSSFIDEVLEMAAYRYVDDFRKVLKKPEFKMTIVERLQNYTSL